MAAWPCVAPPTKHHTLGSSRFQADLSIVALGEEKVQTALAKADEQLLELERARALQEAAVNAEEEQLKKEIALVHERAAKKLNDIAAAREVVKDSRCGAVCALRELISWPKLLSSTTGCLPWPLIGIYLFQEEIVCILGVTSPLIHHLTTQGTVGLFPLTKLELGHLRDLEYIFGPPWTKTADSCMPKPTLRSGQVAEAMLCAIHLPSLRVLDLGHDSFNLPLTTEILKRLAAYVSEGLCLRSLQEFRVRVSGDEDTFKKYSVGIIIGAPVKTLSLQGPPVEHVADLFVRSDRKGMQQATVNDGMQDCWQLSSTLEVLDLHFDHFSTRCASKLVKLPFCDPLPQLKFLELHGMGATPAALGQLLVAAPKLKWLNLWIQFVGSAVESQSLLELFTDFAATNSVSFARWPTHDLSYDGAVVSRRRLAHVLIFEASPRSICIADHIPSFPEGIMKDYAEMFRSQFAREAFDFKLFRHAFSELGPRQHGYIYEHCRGDYSECDCSKCNWLQLQWSSLEAADKALWQDAAFHLKKASFADMLVKFDVKSEDLRDRFVAALSENRISEDTFRDPIRLKDKYLTIINPDAWEPTNFQLDRISQNIFPVTMWRTVEKSTGSWPAIRRLGCVSSLVGIFTGDDEAHRWHLKAHFIRDQIQRKEKQRKEESRLSASKLRKRGRK